jgi:uncharacterized surface protein with fasciclin (FAS1) repeats
MSRRRLLLAAPALLVGLPLVAQAQAGRTVFDVIAGARGLQKFTALVRQAGLEAHLKAAGPYGVFAPTDGAFDHLGALMLREVETNAEYRRRLVQNHITGYTRVLVPGGNMDATFGMSATTQSEAGQELRIADGNTGLPSINNVRVGLTNIQASNGIVHTIENFLAL